MVDPCLDANDAIALVEGDVSVERRSQDEAHLAECPSCRRLIAELARTVDGNDEDMEWASDTPTQVGRYEVRELVGRGGMGEVYEAYDPKLDRLIALKLVSPQPGETGSDGHSRLIREAHALAKIAHPNVVSVFDVGDFGERVFIAMELVQGVTLREWLSEERSTRDILSMFIDAGRGLAAAHRSAMVHRDFKPTNVLVGEDGRPRVLDFGLVRASGERDESEGTGSLAAVEMTQTGVVVGTPAYMAPEQFLGKEIDSRADQFSFAVALYEALFGKRPFSGNNVEELARAVVDGDVGELPVRDGVSKQVKRAILRALEAKPDGRFASMDELLSELEPRRALAPLLAAGVGLTAVAAFGIWAAIPQGNTSCKNAGDDADSLWRSSDSTIAQDRIAGSGHPTPGAAHQRIEKGLTNYREKWRRLHIRTCRATHIEKTQTQDRFEHQLTCLYDGLERAKAVAARLERVAQPIDVDSAIAAVAKLPDLEQCETVTPTQAQRPLPPEASRKEVVEIRAQIASVAVDIDVGSDANIESAKALVQRAKDIGFAPLTAEALYLVGRALNADGSNSKAEETLREAVTLAAGTNYDPLLAQLWIELIMALFEQAKYDEAIAMAPVAEAAMLRANSEARVRARGLNIIGEAYWWQRDVDTAIVKLKGGVELIEKAYGENDPDLPLALTFVAELQAERGELDEALAIADRAIALADRTFGPDHTFTIWGSVVRSIVLVRFERFEEVLATLGNAIPRLLKITGGHPEIAWARKAEGDAHRGLGNYAEAIAAYRSGMAMTAEAYGSEDYRISSQLRGIGRAQGALGDWREGQRTLEQARSIRRKTRGSSHVSVADVEVDMARLNHEAKQITAALQHAERAETIYRGADFNIAVATTRALKARILWETPATRKSAETLASETIDELTALGQTKSADELRRWLSARTATNERRGTTP